MNGIKRRLIEIGRERAAREKMAEMVHRRKTAALRKSLREMDRIMSELSKKRDSLAESYADALLYCGEDSDEFANEQKVWNEFYPTYKILERCTEKRHRKLESMEMEYRLRLSVIKTEYEHQLGLVAAEVRGWPPSALMSA